MSIRPTALVLAGLSTLTVLAQAGAASAAEIKVLCSNGIKAVMEELVPQFEKATKHKVVITYGLSAALKRQIEAGEQFDHRRSYSFVDRRSHQAGQGRGRHSHHARSFRDGPGDSSGRAQAGHSHDRRA